MATIRKHWDKYQVQVRRKGFSPVTKTFHRLSDAKEWARLKETQADRQEMPADKRVLEGITLAFLVERYRDEVLPNKRGGDFETIILDAFLRHPITKKTLADLSPSDFASWRDEKLTAKDGRKAITAKSVKRLLSPVQHMFQLAMDEWGVPLRENPLARFKLKVIDNKRQRRLRQGELEILIEASKKTRNPYALLIMLFAIETAMRRGEILALRWRDIDLERHSATILETKNGHSRVIPLTDAAVDVAKRAAKLTTEKNMEANGLIFPVPANAFKLVWKRLVKRAKLDDLHFHDLRHEAISQYFEMGLSVPEVASISGHLDMRMLFRYAQANHALVRAKLSIFGSDTPCIGTAKHLPTIDNKVDELA